MKHSGATGFSPVWTTQPGCCLTPANWQETGILSASFYLSALLMKPGFELLTTLNDLASYVGWSGELILNATLARNAKGSYTVQSLYDGSRSSYSPETIIDLLHCLKPDVVILPVGMRDQKTLWQDLAQQSRVFFPSNEIVCHDALDDECGVYYDVHGMSSEAMLSILAHATEQSSYVVGDLRLTEMHALHKLGVTRIESDCPAYDACQGKVYTEQGIIDLSQSDYAMQFSTIQKNCTCPTCSQQFTCAYLHHLYHHTPLLCQRFLIQHNVHFCQHALAHCLHNFDR